MKKLVLFLLGIFAATTAQAVDCPIGQKKFYVAFQSMTVKSRPSIGATYYCGDTQTPKTEEGLNQIEQYIRKQGKGLDNAVIVITAILPLDR
jgi:hypothetical protein